MISEATRARIDAEIARMPERRGALLAALHLVERELGCVAPEAARELAVIFGIRPVEVMEVVSFYNLFHERPVGRHRVYVCTNLPPASTSRWRSSSRSSSRAPRSEHGRLVHT